VGKVKKPGEVTGTRKTRKQTAKKVPNGAKRGAASRKSIRARKKDGARRGAVGTKVSEGRKAARGAKRTARAGKRGATPAAPPVVSFRVKPLDPVARCGTRTSVEKLYRVDESVDGKPRPHLVFLDRHGWYCEHGRNCPAVAHARRLDEKHARTDGRNPNGRMRA